MPDFDKYCNYIRKLWDSKWLTNNGPYHNELEERLEDYLKVKNLSLVQNGTLALMIALEIFDFKPGDQVITTPFSFVATTSSIVWQRYVPKFVDIDSETFNIDPKKIEESITEKTKAILAVHVFGNPCEVEKINKIAKKYDLKVIYDAAHCFGVEYNGHSILNHGDISTLSFHATKVFHTIEGGAIVTKDKDIHKKVNSLREFGYGGVNEAENIGINAKMNEFEAIMGLLNLEKIDIWIEKRKQIYDFYMYKFSKFSFLDFQKMNENMTKYNYIYLPILFPSQAIRDRIYKKLLENNINSRKYFYPITTKLKKYQKYDENLLNALNISQRILTLPLYPELSKENVEKIISIISHNL